MDSQSIREAAMAAPRKTQDVSTPFWPGTDGQIIIVDQDLSELSAMTPLSKTDPSAYNAALVIKVLASKETGLPVFSDADRDWIRGQASVVMPLTKIINEFFGFGPAKEAVAESKNG